MPVPRPTKAKLFVEIAIRALLMLLFCLMEKMPAFIRYATLEELQQYRYPVSASYVTPAALWYGVVLTPCAIAALAHLAQLEDDAAQSSLALTLAYGINGVVTDFMKLTVGRFRPDFYNRCFPDGVATKDLNCTGDPRIVMEGRKSFPSGHSSFAFTGLGFASLWICGRLGVLCARGRGSAPRALAALAPLLVALGVAISRTCDYHHHWQDVLVGSMIGMTITYFSYRQHYHSLSSEHAGLPYSSDNRYKDIKI